MLCPIELQTHFFDFDTNNAVLCTYVNFTAFFPVVDLAGFSALFGIHWLLNGYQQNPAKFKSIAASLIHFYSAKQHNTLPYPGLPVKREYWFGGIHRK
ncbi:MAG: hypothetical protein GX455_05405 [Phycisphaerae bacterium]|nr:hypothetical protein [Phycisphaerae bacterium]